MGRIVFIVTLVAEVLSAVSVVVSIAFPDRRIWPPLQNRRWTGILMGLFFTVSGMGVIALGILDWGSLNLPLWLRWGMGMPLWTVGNGLALWAIVVLGMVTTLGEAEGLIQRGPYRYSRNPQSIGFIVGLIGWAMVSSSTMTLDVTNHVGRGIFGWGTAAGLGALRGGTMAGGKVWRSL